MAYASLIQRLSRRGLFRIEPGLQRIQTVLQILGNPQEAPKTIHIAGTNGKGSVAISLESILRQAGYRTGLYTSPHLWDVRERIQMDRRPISIAKFEEAAQRVFAAERKAGFALTYFEFLTAMAFVTFARATVDVAIIETGMGGRWDATNVVTHPALTLITSIGLDHTQWLGRTETQIAREKAGILKKGSPLISGVRGEAARVIQTEARKRQAPVYWIDHAFYGETTGVDWERGVQSMLYSGIAERPKKFQTPLIGRHQTDNAALVLSAIDILRKKGWPIPATAIQRGFLDVSWPGRFQWAESSHGTRIVFDGAHNPPAIQRLLETLDDSPWKSTPKVFVFSAYRDKDVATLLPLIQSRAQDVILCTMPGSRALPARQLLRAAIPKTSSRVHVVANPHAALQAATRLAKKSDLIVVTGSLTLVGILLHPHPLTPSPSTGRRGTITLSLRRERVAEGRVRVHV